MRVCVYVLGGGGVYSEREEKDGDRERWEGVNRAGGTRGKKWNLV